jgi:hypothetical protein
MMKSAYAAHRGVKPSAVSNWAAKGLLVYGEDPARPGKRLVDVEKTDLLVNGSVDQTRGRPRSSEASTAVALSEDGPVAPAARPVQLSGPEAVRMEEARERVIGRRIDNERALQKLVDRGEVERRAAERGRMIRERVTAVVRNQAERLASETDPRVIVALLTGEFDGVFARIADEIEAEARTEAAVDAALEQLPDEEVEDGAEAA